MKEIHTLHIKTHNYVLRIVCVCVYVCGVCGCVCVCVVCVVCVWVCVWVGVGVVCGCVRVTSCQDAVIQSSSRSWSIEILRYKSNISNKMIIISQNNTLGNLTLTGGLV